MSTVLIVDDEKNILKTLSMSLNRNAFHVKQAQSGPDALKIIREELCDYVISDVRMSPMDGFTLTRKIYHDFPWIEIILMSAYAFEESADKNVDCVPYHKVKKPFEVNDLVQFLKDRDHVRVKQKRIAYWGDEWFGHAVCFQLKNAGFNAIDLNILEPMLGTKNGKCDLYLIDGKILNSNRWKILNRLDSQTPDIPVVILAESGWKGKKTGDQDSNSIILDRQKFLKDLETGITELQCYIK